MMHMLTLF